MCGDVRVVVCGAELNCHEGNGVRGVVEREEYAVLAALVEEV